MKPSEIKAGKTYTNNSKRREIHRFVEKVADGKVYFIVKESPFMSGWNAIGNRDWISLKDFAKWAKGDVST